MNWEHAVSRDWLDARRNVITATELIGLISPFNGASKKAKASGIIPAFAALWAEKNSIHESDPMSYGPAARGHIMEPFAVEEYNSNYYQNFYHWDDCIIKNNGVGFSPDALDIEQPGDSVEMFVDHGKLTDGKSIYDMPKSLLEIKSYNPGHHYQNMLANKMAAQLNPERRQIAAAMLTLPSIEVGTLVQYCPQAPHAMFRKMFSREELADDIELLDAVLSEWNKTCRYMETLAPEVSNMKYTEADIYKMYLMDKGVDVFAM